MDSDDTPPKDSVPTYDPWLQTISSLAQNALLYLKSWSPQLVPIVICLAALPLLILFSLVAGWTVWSSVPRGWSMPVYLQYGDGAVPYSNLEITSLSTNQPYEISLHLNVPASESNYALGNFMTSFTVTTYANATVLDVRKPALVIPPASSLLPFSRAPRLLQITIPLASSLITGVSRVRVHIELGRKDSWKSLGQGEGRELSVYEASLHGVVRHQGLRRIVAMFPLSISIAAAITFFTVSTVILVGCLLPAMFESQYIEETDKEVKTEQIELKSPLEDPSAFLGTRHRSSRVKEESEEEGLELSPQTYTMPEPDVRRRFKRSSTAHDDQ